MFEAIEIGEGDLTAHVLIEPEAIELMSIPSVQCIVEIVSEGFVGVNRCVFFDFEDIRRFITDAERLLNAHTGQATLDTMSPGALKLVIWPYGKAGHLQAIVSMIKPAYGFRHDFSWHKLETTFAVDRYSLSEALIAFRKLIQVDQAQ